MSEKVDPSVIQTGYLHYINKKLGDILKVLSMSIPEGRVARFRFNINGSRVIDISSLTGSNIMSLTLKNSGGNVIRVGININSGDLLIEPGEAIPINFGSKIIKYIYVESSESTLDIIAMW